MTTPKLQMPELVVGQAGKELTHNQALAVLDQLAQAVVVDKDLTSPPGSPANGSMYIVAAGATDAWSGQSGKLAYWLATVAAWTFITPADGWSLWVTDEAVRYERKAGSWAISSAGANSAALDGLTGAADKLPYFTGVGALALADYTPVARTFDAATTVAAQRTALGLGTAATATLTTSTTDLTTGRVVKVGDFGNYAYLDAVGAIDANSLVTPGLHIVVDARPAAGVSANFPNLSEIWSVDVIGGQNSSRCYQSARSLTGHILTRSRLDATWSAWEASWSSLRSNAITVDTGSVGYGTGSGGTVTQATSKATAVTLNKPSGQITTAGDALSANTAVSFTMTNNKISASDVPSVAIKSGATAGAYVVQVDAVAAGSCRISVRNLSAGPLSEAIVLSFVITKGATA